MTRNDDTDPAPPSGNRALSVLGGPEQRSPGRVKRFALDFEKLAEEGFFHPSADAQRLSLELRAIKRRLVRRLDFRRKKRRAGPQSAEGAKRQRNLLLVTSTRPSEGKTFTSLNLALSFAVEDNIKVLLIDADLSRPRVRHHLNIAGKPEGLFELIDEAEETSLGACVYRANDVPLLVLPEGRGANSGTELFMEEETGEFLSKLSASFPDHLIIIDAPPVMAMADAVLLAPHVDEVIYVVEANETAEAAVASGLDELLDVQENVSLVLNRSLVPDPSDHYGSYSEYYSHESRKD